MPLFLPFQNCFTASDTPFSQFFSFLHRFSSSLPLWLGLSLPREFGLFSPFCQICGAHRFRHATIQLWSHASLFTSIFCTMSGLLPVYPLFFRNHVLPGGAFSISSNFLKQKFGPLHLPILFCFLFHMITCPLPPTTLFDASFPLLLSTKIHFSFGFGLSSSQPFHSTKQ